VQRGPICTAGTTCGSDRNLLDFIDVTVSKQGRIEAAYADGCIGSCVTGGANNHDAYASIARQSGGLGLFSQFDPNVPNLTLSRLDVTKGSTMFTAKFTVTNTGHRAINAVGSAIYDNGTKVRSTATLDWAVGASRTFTLSWTPTSVSKHTVTVVADPTNKVAESNERDNKGTQVVYR
jgi:hypothetical protein